MQLGAVDAVLRRLHVALGARAELAIGVARTQLLLEGGATDRDHPLLRELALRMHDHQLGGVQILPGVSRVELDALIDGLSASPLRGGEPLAARATEYRASWPHVRLSPMAFEQLALLEDGDSPESDASRQTRAMQLWGALANAALSGEGVGDSVIGPEMVAHLLEQRLGLPDMDEHLSRLLQEAMEEGGAKGAEGAARLREHLRIPGMGETRARLFRDKLAMRVRAVEEGIPVPDFVGVIHHDDIRAFCERVPAPWMLKPRTEASSTCIQKIESTEQLWSALEALGDRQSQFLLEKYLPGDVHHVDSIVTEGKVVFSEVHRNGIPPFDVSHAGGVFSTYTIQRGSEDEQALKALNEKVLTRFGLLRGTAHLEYIKGRDGVYYFLEAGARVGGAHVAEVVEAATGINLWAEWADIEIDKGEVPYVLPKARQEYGGLVQSLARQEVPDTSSFDDPEVVFRLHDKYHAGLVVRSPDKARIDALLEDYKVRFARDFVAVMPHYELPPQR